METRFFALRYVCSQGSGCALRVRSAEALESSQPKNFRDTWPSLRACDLVSDHREGQWVFYRIHPKSPSLGKTRTTSSRQHWWRMPFQADLRRLEATW